MELQLPFLFTISLLLIITFMAIKRSYKSAGTQTKTPPGPWKLPFIGSMHHLIMSKLPHHTLRDLALKHGPLMHLRLGQVDHVVVSSREAAEEIMKTHDLNFASRPVLAAPNLIVYGCTDIAFAPYGSYWRQLRKICVVELLSIKRVKSFSSLREEETLNLIKDLSMSTKTPINLTEKLLSLTNTIVSRAAFGDKCRHQQRFISVVRDSMVLATGFCVADLFPTLKFIDIVSGFRFKLEGFHTKIDGMLHEIIKEHQAKMVAEKDNFNLDNKPKAEDLVDVLLRLKDHGELEFPITINNMKAVILDMFIGGTETTATIVDWAMAELMKNPGVMEKAQKEVREALKGKGKVEESDVSELSFVKLVIKETLRLHPPIPLVVPRVSKETCRVLGHDIPAGCRVLVNAWALGRDPRYWEDAERFKPERFEGSTIDFKGADFEFIPFGAGRRICPGIGFALAGMELILAQLLFYFDWKLPGGMKAEDLDMTESFGVSAVRKSQLHLLAIPRVLVPTV